MATPPDVKRAVVFVDGQNLFHAARRAFGYTYPNYDVHALAATVCGGRAWDLAGVRFYTGIPNKADDPFWHQFWTAKLLFMSRQGVTVTTRTVRRRTIRKRGHDGATITVSDSEEKGIDVRIALDVMRMAYRRQFDVAVIFNQDQDLSEVASEVRALAYEQGRWVWMASAFPDSSSSPNRKGIARTEPIAIDRHSYDACLDPRDYRRRAGKSP